MTVDRFLLVIAFFCFLLAAIGVSVERRDLVALGLACWVLTLIF